MITKTILKNTHLDTVIRISNPDDFVQVINIDLLSDLKRNNETKDDSVQVGIRMVDWSLDFDDGYGKIIRDSDSIFYLHNSHAFENSQTMVLEKSDKNISVEMTTGTIIMHLIKRSGYVAKYNTEPAYPQNIWDDTSVWEDSKKWIG